MKEKPKYKWTDIIILVAALSFVLFILSCEPRSSLPVFDVMLKVIKDDSGRITHIEVGLEMPHREKKQEKPFTLMAPVKYTVTNGIADRIEDLRVTDEKGRVGLKQLDDKPAYEGMVVWRRWQAQRLLEGTVRVHYRARVPEQVRRMPGPPYHLSLNGGGVSGAGCGFMALPEESGEYRIRLKWDLSQLGPGASAVTSLGEGDFETEGPINRLFQSYYMAGPLGKYPEEGQNNGFSGAWLGDPPFDAHELMAWSADAFNALKTFFRDKSSPSYRFFMRVGPADMGGGGTALYDSFMLYVPVEPELAEDPKWTIFHEMTHKWVGGIEGPAGETFWFSEGLTVHYTRLLMYRAGLCTEEEFLEDVNRTVSEFLTNPLRNMPNHEIGQMFWRDRNAQRLPYQRGSLYFAYVDGKIREASEGKRSLDDVVLSLFERRDNSEPLTKETWLKELEKEIGSDAVNDFESIIVRGEDFIPSSMAFGSCFKRVPVKLRPFELGFDERDSLYTEERYIRGLVKGSNAARAGLQNGDRILNKVNLRKARNNENQRIKLHVRRGEETLEIEYLPRSEPVDGYKWVRIPGVPEEQCRERIIIEIPV